MGRPHWEQQGFSQAQMQSYDRRAAEWNYLVSPATYATPLLRRDFGYDGEVLEIGYPRNDVLLSDEADQVRAAVRESLGVRPEQTAVLYAPTFRDYMSRDDNQAVMPSFFDFATCPQPTRGRHGLPDPRPRVQCTHQAPDRPPPRHD